jgi:addiction module RelB/DinJ family antitoxin
MSNYAMINLKTDPELKALAAKTADKLGISLSAVLNNELRRFTSEQSVSFTVPEVPNESTARTLDASKKRIDSGDYHKFDSSSEAINFLSEKLK